MGWKVIQLALTQPLFKNYIMKNKFPWYFRIPLLFFGIWGLMEFFIDGGDMPAFIAYPITQAFLVFILLLLIGIELILNAIENVMFQTLSPEAQERYMAATSKPIVSFNWVKRGYLKLVGHDKVSPDEVIELDHNYDGIRELDNNLPPWWVYMFYATMIFGVVYLVRFHIVKEYDQTLEFQQEMAQAQIDIEQYKKTAKNLVDANTVTLLTDAADLKAGKALYDSNCVACHAPDGGGGIGPNLTDQHWILGGGIKKVFTTISEGGRDGKGMIAWKQNLKPLEMAQVASYVLGMQGVTPANPKEAQGDLLWPTADAIE